MYKDKDKQREANRRIQAKRRAKGVTKGVTDKEWLSQELKKDKYKVIPERTAQGNIRVSKPGDPDYVPQCETTRAFVEGRSQTTAVSNPKRGKDITTFEDLPPDVQRTINHLSSKPDGTIDVDEHAKRTKAAINYQHLYPDRYYSTGVA